MIFDYTENDAGKFTEMIVEYTPKGKSLLDIKFIE
jgi:hypothetical protein